MPVPLLAALRAATELAAPSACAVCGSQASGLCRGCAADAQARWFTPGPRLVGELVSGAPAVAAGAFDGALRGAVHAYKDGERRDLDAILAPGLLAAVVTVLALVEHPASRQVVLVPAPSSRAAERRRGDRPVVRLAHLAAAAVPSLGAVVVPALRVGRRVQDQSVLGRVERARNVDHAFVVRRDGLGLDCERLCAATVLLVDDVWTTGATASEGARALAAIGIRVAGVATVLATPRRSAPGAPRASTSRHDEARPATPLESSCVDAHTGPVGE